MNCPGSIWLEKKSNKHMIYRLKSSLKFALAGALSTFVPLDVTVHLHRASSSLKRAVSVAQQPSEEKFQGCSAATALQYHTERSKTSVTLSWGEGSDLTTELGQPSCLSSFCNTAHSDFKIYFHPPQLLDATVNWLQHSANSMYIHSPGFSVTTVVVNFLQHMCVL